MSPPSAAASFNVILNLGQSLFHHNEETLLFAVVIPNVLNASDCLGKTLDTKQMSVNMRNKNAAKTFHAPQMMNL